jgi:hypothetical protein
MLASPPKGGAPSPSLTSMVGAPGPIDSTPRGPAIDDVSTSVVAAAGHAGSTPRGPAIDVFNFDSGRCRTYDQHPPGGPPSTSPTSGPPAPAPPWGPPSTRFLALMVDALGHLASAPPHRAHR